MIETDHLWWAGANILFPFLVPIVLFKFIQWVSFGLGTPDQQERLRITYLLKEGQFGLSSAAVSAAAFYELMFTPGALAHPLGKTLLVSLVVLGFLSILVFVLGTIFVAPDVKRNVTVETSYAQWFTMYRAGAASILLAVAVAFCAFVAHVHASPAKPDGKVFSGTAEDSSKP